MADGGEEIRFLREKADLLRKLANKYRLPAGNDLIKIADELDRKATDTERRR